MNSPKKRKLNLAGFKKSHEQCINLALDLLRLQCVTHDSANGQAGRKGNAAWTGNNWAFELCYYLFDAGVTLMSGFAKMPVEARATEAQELVQRSIDILETASQEGQEGSSTVNGGRAKREIASRASEVLNMLGRELGWRQESAETNPQHTTDSQSQFHAHTLPASPPTVPPMNSFGFVPQSPLPVPMDVTNSTPLSMFFAAPQGSSLLSSFAQQTDLSQLPLWSDLQNQSGTGSFGSSNGVSWDPLE
jgi:hypothetical protein